MIRSTIEKSAGKREAETVEIDVVQSYCDALLEQYQSADSTIPRMLSASVEDDLQERCPNPEQLPRAVFLFLQRLLQHIEVARTQKNSQTLDALITIGSRLVAEGSDNLPTCLPLAERFAFFSRTLRTPELDEWKTGMRTTLLLDVARWDAETIQRLVHFTQSLPAHEALDVIHGCESMLALSSIGEQESVEARNSNIYALLHELQDASPYPFVQLAAKAVVQKISQLDSAALIAQQHNNQFPVRADDSIAVAKDYGGASDSRGIITHVYSDEPKTIAETLQDPRILPFHHILSPESAEIVLQQLHRPYMREYIEQQFGIQLSEMTLRAQLQLLGFLAQGDAATIERMQRILRDSPMDAHTQQAYSETFFAASENASIANQLLDAAEQLPAEMLGHICTAYQRLTQSIEQIETVIHNAFTTEDTAQRIDTRLVVQEWVKRANTILLNCVAAKKPEQIQALIHTTEDALQFAAICKVALKNNPDLHFEDFQHLQYETVSGADFLTPQNSDVDVMIRIAEKNYAHNTELAQRFAAFMKPQTAAAEQQLAQNQFVVLKRQGEIISFLRVEPRENDRVFVASFNVHPDIRGAGIGEHMLQHTIGTLRETQTVIGTFTPEIAAGTHYIEKLGNVATLFDDDVQKTGTPFGWFEMEIQRDPLPYTLRKSEYTKNTLAQMCTEEYIQDTPFIVTAFDVDTPEHIQYAVQQCKKLINEQGYHLVRYCCMNETCTRRLYGFEKPPAATNTPTTRST